MFVSLVTGSLLLESRKDFDDLAAAKGSIRTEIKRCGGSNPVVRLVWDEMRFEVEFDVEAETPDDAREKGLSVLRVAASAFWRPALAVRLDSVTAPRAFFQ